MKSEKDFLDDMWSDIVKVEFEETQKQLAKERSLRVTRNNRLIYAAVIILFSLICVYLYFGEASVFSGVLYPTAIILMIFGFITQDVRSRE